MSRDMIVYFLTGGLGFRATKLSATATCALNYRIYLLEASEYYGSYYEALASLKILNVLGDTFGGAEPGHLALWRVLSRILMANSFRGYRAGTMGVLNFYDFQATRSSWHLQKYKVQHVNRQCIALSHEMRTRRGWVRC